MRPARERLPDDMAGYPAAGRDSEERAGGRDENSLHQLLAQIMRLYFCRTYGILEKWDVHPGQVQVLFELQRRDGMNQKELADKLMVRPPTVAVTIKRMERNGLLQRRPDADDQRITHIHLTAKGEEYCRNIKGAVEDVEQLCLRDFTFEETVLMKRFFLQMRDNLADTCRSQETGRKAGRC